jgi:hypothetical protein
MFQPTSSGASTGDIEPEKFTNWGCSHTNVSLPLHGISIEVEWERKSTFTYQKICNRQKYFKPKYWSKSMSKGG